MFYTVAIHKDEDSDYSVTVPDIPGCFSAGVTIEKALREAAEAIQGHLGILAEDGENIPVPGDMLEHQANPDFKDAVWCGVSVDITPYLGKTEKINVTLPTLISAKIAQAGIGNRSAFLAEAAAEKLAREYAN
ncbi:MAG: putative RNase H-like HicB family nuclease [Kiritimatiellia bacterium]|jgi:predicted RNase H-like HicB family nuclease